MRQDQREIPQHGSFLNECDVTVHFVRFHLVGKALAPLLEYVFSKTTRDELSGPLKEALTVSILSKARLRGHIDSRASLQQARGLLDDGVPEYVHASVAYWESVIERLDGQYGASQRAVTRYYDRRNAKRPANNKRLNALHGHLWISLLETQLQLNDYGDSRSTIAEGDWTVLQEQCQSAMEVRVTRRKWLLLSKMLVSEGDFPRARDCLKDCLNSLNQLGHILPDDMIRYRVISALCDVYSNLGDFCSAHSIIAVEIEKLSVKDVLPKSYRRLLVSALEIDIARKSYDEAHAKVRTLEHKFSSINKLDSSDELLHIRTVVAAGRVLHLQGRFREAIRRWESVLALIKKYRTFRDEGFTYAFTRLSIGLSYLRLHQTPNNSMAPIETFSISDASDAIDGGISILGRQRPDYWIPTIVTDWIPYLISEIHVSKPGWKNLEVPWSPLAKI